MDATRTTKTFLLAVAAVGATLLAGAPAPGADLRPIRVPLAMGDQETVRTYTTSPPEGPTTTPVPVAVADDTGIVTVVWSEDGLRSAQRDLTGHWSDPAPLGTCRTDVQHCTNGSYSLGVDGAGTVTAVWDQSVFDGTTFSDTVFVSSLPRAGTWTPPEPLGVSHRGFSPPSLAVARNGAALVAYDEWPGRRGQVTRAVYRAPGTTWASARWHVFHDAQQPQVGLSDTGRAVLLVRRAWPSDQHLRVHRSRTGVLWSRPTGLGTSVHLDIPPYSLAVDGSGRAVVAWSHGRRPVMQARTMNRRGVWSAVRTLSRPGSAYSEAPLVAMGGRADVVWSTQHHAIAWAAKGPGRPWRTRIAYPAGSGAEVALLRGRGAEGGLLWQHWSGVPQLYAGLRTRAGGWTSGLRVPAQFDDPSAYGSAAMLPDGSMLVLTYSTTYTVPGAAEVSVIARALRPAS